MRRWARIVIRAAATLLGIALIAIGGLATYRFIAQQHAERGRAIRSSDGVAESLALDVGGIPQWIQIRGEDRNNPLLLALHGGPGAPMRPWGYTFQTPWERHFTVVHWDQPCGGKTYEMNREAGCGDLSLERIAEDGVAVIRYLLARIGDEKLVLLGHSWGSMVGLEIARHHPELLHAYVGSGQVVDNEEAEAVSIAWTLERARESGNAEAIAELEALQPFDPEGSWGRHWPWLVHFGGENWRHRNDFYMVWKLFLSPGTTLDDMRRWLEGNSLSRRELRADNRAFDARRDIGTELEVPVLFFLGRHDFNTPRPLAEAYLEEISAPVKRLVIFDHSAHSPMWEEPEAYLEALKAHVLPLAVS